MNPIKFLNICPCLTIFVDILNKRFQYKHLLKILGRGIAEECFRPLDSLLTLNHILGVCIFYFTVHENWKHLTPEIERLSPEMLEKHTETAIEFVLAGVKKTP
jgi:TetR/AcrR family transcriptional regulator